MKKLFVLAAATLVMGSVFAQEGGKDKKKEKDCCKKEGKECCKKGDKKDAKTATVTPAAKTPAAKKA